MTDPWRDPDAEVMESVDALLERMRNQRGATMDFVVRSVDADLQRTISADALDALGRNMKMWVGSRIIRKWRSMGQAPKKIRVSVRVEFDDMSTDFGVPFFAWEVLDGARRDAVVAELRGS